MGENVNSLIGAAPSQPDVGDPDDIRAALQTRGCPVCNHLIGVTFEFFCHFQHDLVTKENLQREFSLGGGFCARHTWQFAAGASPLGLSIGCHAWVERIGIGLRDSKGGQEADLNDGVLLVAQPSCCRLCAPLLDAQAVFVGRLAAFVSNDHGREAYARSQGVCLPHLEKLRIAINASETKEFVVNHAGRRLIELAEYMRSYARKREARQRFLLTADEKGAYIRALVYLVGDKRVFLP